MIKVSSVGFEITPQHYGFSLHQNRAEPAPIDNNYKNQLSYEDIRKSLEYNLNLSGYPKSQANLILSNMNKKRV